MTLDGHVFVSPGDITQLAVHAIAYSASTLFGMNGSMYAAFRENVPGFADRFSDLRRDHAGQAAVGELTAWPSWSRPAMVLLLEGLMLNRTFLFLGYGLRDINFRQVYGRVGRMLRQAHRPAYATSFESAGEAGEYVARQWAEKGLHLIDIPGATDEARERNLLIFLDRLADRVASASPRLLLARDAEAFGTLARLRALLLAAGEEVAGIGLPGPDAVTGLPASGRVITDA